MSILYAISIVYIAGEYCGPGFCTPLGVSISRAEQPTSVLSVQQYKKNKIRKKHYIKYIYIQMCKIHHT